MSTVVVYKHNTRNKKERIERRSRVHNYNFLKWWRVVRYWAKRKYNITTEELEVLLYLYDEELFTRKKFKEFEGILDWDKERFQHFINKGWVVKWRDRSKQREANLWTLSVQAKRICSAVYSRLMQDEPIAETKRNNPIMKGQTYADKVYRNAIKRMNKVREAKIKAEREKNL